MGNGLNIEFIDLPGEPHVCTSFWQGDVLIFRCPLCDGYERRYNSRTGVMSVRRGGSTATHVGQSFNGLPDMDGLSLAAMQGDKLN